MLYSEGKEKHKMIQSICFSVETDGRQLSHSVPSISTFNYDFDEKLAKTSDSQTQYSSRTPAYKKGCLTKYKTYSSRDSHVVTHRSTNLPFNCLCMAERTGCPVFS
jgi:hypothetical protein